MVGVTLCVGVALLGGVAAQSLTCPTSITKNANFLVIGASGGDSVAACENTAAATTAGLAAGMNAVELDISISLDQVVFLWNDPNPLEPEAVARSKGLFVPGKCNPQFKVLNRARDLVFSAIKKNYVYVDGSGVDQGANIPTLTEWMDLFAANAALERIYIDVKEVDISLADFIVNHIFDKATALGVTAKLRLLSADYAMTGALQTALGKRGLSVNLASKAYGGTLGTVHLGDSESFNAVTDAASECYETAAVGQTASSSAWRGYQNIINRSIATRTTLATTGGRYYSILSWRINSIEKMSWLLCTGVDGIFTDQVSTLAKLNAELKAGQKKCCNTETSTLPCLTRLDPRVMGQGCASKGIIYSDLEVNQCPLFDLDILYTGIQLKCLRTSLC